MIIYIFGDDNYLGQRRLINLKEKFKEKYGDINISHFRIEKKEEINVAKIISEIETMPFLGAKRLIIIKNFTINGDPKSKEKISKKLKSISENSIVIFYEEGTVKKNDKLYRLLFKIAKIEQFPDLRGGALLNFIKKEAAKHKTNIEPQAIERLAYLVGSDTWRLSCEIEKLSNYSYPHDVNCKDVELLVIETLQTKIFDMVDSLARRDGHSALLTFHKLIKMGEEKEYLFSMIVYSFRNLILVKYLKENNENLKEFEIVQKLSLHPFVVKKAISSSQYFSYLELKKIYQRLVIANLEMRKGNFDPVFTLDLLLSEICAR